MSSVGPLNHTPDQCTISGNKLQAKNKPVEGEVGNF